VRESSSQISDAESQRNINESPIGSALEMSKKRKSKSEPSAGVWVAQKYSLKGPTGERAWENRPGGPPSSSRFLELADIALGLKKKELAKKRNTAIHEAKKAEPYSS
jgi:hypothetical protein